MNNNLRVSIRKIGVASILIWLTVLITGAVSIWFFRSFDPERDLIEQGIQLNIIKNIIFLLSLGVCIYGVIVSIPLANILKKEDINGGRYVVVSMGMMLLSTLMSMQSISGINIYFVELTVLDKVNEILSRVPFHGLISLTAILVFMASAIIYFIGIDKITYGSKDKFAAINGLKWVRNSSMILMIATLLFSPILLAYIATNQFKFEDTLTINLISGTVYAIAFVLFFLSWVKANNLTITPSSDIIIPNYQPIEMGLKYSLKKVGKSYLYVWLCIICSMASLVGYILTSSTFSAIMSISIFIVGWCAIIYGIWTASQLSTLLKLRSIQRVIWQVIPFYILSGVSLLSFNTLTGGNIDLAGFFDWESIAELLSDFSIEEFFGDPVLYLGLFSLLLFLLFPVSSLVATTMLSQYIPALKKSIWGASIIVVASVVFAPICIYVNTEEYIDNIILYFLITLCFYACGVYFMVKYWRQCDKIKEVISADVATIPMSDLTPSPEAKTFKEWLGMIIKDRYMKIIVAISIISIILSAWCIIPKLFESKPSSERNNFTIDKPIEVGENDDVIEVIGESESIDEIEVIQDEDEIYTIHQDGYEETMEERDIQQNIEILRKLYNGIVLFMDNTNYLNMSEQAQHAFINSHFSKQMRNRLKKANGYDDDGYSIEELRTGVQDGDGPSKITKISHLKDNWYRVEFLDMGYKGHKDFLIEYGVITNYK